MQDVQKTQERRKDSGSAFRIKKLVNLSLLIAIQIVLTRIFVVDLGAYRISFGSVATILAGLWMGPVAGAVCGFAADILGCLLKGFVVNPFITAAAMGWGVIPSLSVKIFGGRLKNIKARTILLIASIILAAVVCSLILTTAGLVLLLGYHLYAILPGRLVQTAILCPCYCMVTCMVYYSPITAFVTKSMY
ncbi:MAG: folate family ECF transporter S component [Blautia sp.]|nr:folate family ECF transporter S component [Blautia sp.]